MTSSQFKIIRLQLGLNQTELGEKMGMLQQAVQRIESGDRQPTKQQAATISLIKEYTSLIKEYSQKTEETCYTRRIEDPQ